MSSNSNRNERTVRTLKFVKVIKDIDWDEYQAVSRFIKPADRGDEVYHASDKQDALDTAEVMDRQMVTAGDLDHV